MPVYMRKRQDSLSLSQLSEPSPDIDADFSLDPDKHRDPLPQPYRFIDKVIDDLMERSFQEMFSREEERVHEQARHKPPQVPTDLCRTVPGIRSSIKFLRPSADLPDPPADQYGSRYLFCACDGGQLLALDSVTMATVGSFEAAGLDLAYLAAAQMKPGLHLLATIDELGLARLFLWDGTAFHLARLLNEDEGEKKINCLAVSLSDDGEYLAATMQNASTQAVTLEFHRIPRDAWAKEVEQQAGKPAATTAAAAAAHANAEDAAAGEAAAEADPSGPNASAEAGRVPALKLSALASVLRVRQPQPPTATAGATAPNLKLIDSAGEVVGSGHGHLLTQAHLQLREANFRRQRPAELRHLAVKPDNGLAPQIALPTVLFLKPGRTFGTEQTMDKNVCVNAAVAWSGDSKVLIYPLLKVGKDLEFRPETVWTFASPVTCLSASHCASLIAIGLESGNLVVHDVRLGLVRHVISVNPDNPRPIAKVFFLNPTADDEQQSDLSGQVVYRSSQPVRAAIYTSDLTPYLADLGPEASPPTAKPLPHSARHSYEAPQLVDYNPLGHPALLMRSTRSGAIVLHDVRLGREVLQFSLPPPYQLPEPWQAGGWAISAGGRSLFIRGRRQLGVGELPADEAAASVVADSADASAEVNQNEERLFCYSLKILVPMRPYWKQRRTEVTPCFAHCRVEQRADDYLQHRHANHTERQKGLVDMWSNLFNTLKEVEASSAAAAANETPRSVKTLRTSFSSLSDDSKDARLKEFLKRADNATAVA